MVLEVTGPCSSPEEIEVVCLWRRKADWITEPVPQASIWAAHRVLPSLSKAEVL